MDSRKDDMVGDIVDLSDGKRYGLLGVKPPTAEELLDILRRWYDERHAFHMCTESNCSVCPGRWRLLADTVELLSRGGRI